MKESDIRFIFYEKSIHVSSRIISAEHHASSFRDTFFTCPVAKKYFRSEIFPRGVSQRGIALSAKFLWKCRSRNTHFSQHFSETKRRSFVRGHTTIICNYAIHTITQATRGIRTLIQAQIRDTHAYAYTNTRWCWSVIACNVECHLTFNPRPILDFR